MGDRTHIADGCCCFDEIVSFVASLLLPFSVSPPPREEASFPFFCPFYLLRRRVCALPLHFTAFVSGVSFHLICASSSVFLFFRFPLSRMASLSLPRFAVPALFFFLRVEGRGLCTVSCTVQLAHRVLAFLSRAYEACACVLTVVSHCDSIFVLLT